MLPLIFQTTISFQRGEGLPCGPAREGFTGCMCCSCLRPECSIAALGIRPEAGYPRMEERLVQRAHEIVSPGAYVGHLELVAWGFKHDRRVKLILGDTMTDLYDWVCDYLGYAFGKAPTIVAHFAAVEFNGATGAWLAVDAHGSQSNHFVIATPRPLAPLEVLTKSLWTPPGGCAKKAALRIGCMLLPTIAQGDCGIDCMAFHAGLPRNEETWQAIRSELSSFLRANSGSALWQDIATMCGEAEVETPPEAPGAPGLGEVLTPWPQKPAVPAVAPCPGTGGSISAQLVVEAPSTAASGTDLEPPPRPIKRERSRSPSPALQDERSDKPRLPRRLCFRHAMRIRGGRLANTSAPRVGFGEIVPIDAEAVPAAEHRLVPLEPCQPARSVTGASRFEDWVLSLAHEDLDRMSACYEAFKEGELKMLRAQGVSKTPVEFKARKHFAATKRATRLAMGAKYHQWRETAVGADSKAPLRDFLRQTHHEYRHAVPKHKRKWLGDCAKA